jgi:hypothetical protein
MTELNVFQAHTIVHQALNAADVPDDVINAWFILSDVLFPHGYADDEGNVGIGTGFVIEFEPDDDFQDAIEDAKRAKPVLTLVPEKK